MWPRGAETSLSGLKKMDKTHKICDKKNFFVTKFDFLVKF